MKGAEINGAIKVDGIDSEYHGTDTALTTVTADLSTYTGSEKGAVIVTNSGNAVFDGKQTLITVDADHAGKVFGVILDKGKAEFNADTTVINVNNTNAIGTWDYAVDVKADSQAVFNGKDVSIKAVKPIIHHRLLLFGIDQRLTLIIQGQQLLKQTVMPVLPLWMSKMAVL